MVRVARSTRKEEMRKAFLRSDGGYPGALTPSLSRPRERGLHDGANHQSRYLPLPPAREGVGMTHQSCLASIDFNFGIGSGRPFEQPNPAPPRDQCSVPWTR